ncbi:hypothetical protein AVEN_173224-1, partial [Araneus ventricosus]
KLNVLIVASGASRVCGHQRSRDVGVDGYSYRFSLLKQGLRQKGPAEAKTQSRTRRKDGPPSPQKQRGCSRAQHFKPNSARSARNFLSQLRRNTVYDGNSNNAVLQQ